ncbi:MAG: hypothetical protein M1815_004438 [Lichina confinis]|nr:MAG: hypothetical protein M1815_004438 [Lichina confinis]
MSTQLTTEDEIHAQAYNPVYNPFGGPRPVIVERDRDEHLFFARPLLGPLLFDNDNSEARDHCACERTFLSWLRLSVYMAIVSCAIVISFHIRNPPSNLERRMALPLGLVFWVTSLASLLSGFATYVKSVTKYSRRQALVQSGWKTQAVFVLMAVALGGTCLLLLLTDEQSPS